ncbi:MAG: hypothetical protein LBL01_05530, partial [Bifidobacteriaceae bacterium]|jgi:hypothetical protein|nr:hypothetical protein [Bifidobacteriaceae bacterium]
VGLAHEDGSPLRLSDEPSAVFRKADETMAPAQLPYAGTGQYRYDLLQSRPYASDMQAAARMVFRADIGSKTTWDNSAWNGASNGAYTSSGMFLQSNAFLAGYTDAASAAGFALATASLQAPGQPGQFVSPDAAGMAAAVGAQAPTGVEGVGETDPGALPTDAYPLTQVLYAEVNLGASDAAARKQYADLIEFAVTDGQSPGRAVGQLPDGYLPLSAELRGQALDAVQAIRDYVPPGEDPEPSPSPSPTPTPSSTPGASRSAEAGWSPAAFASSGAGTAGPGQGGDGTGGPGGEGTEQPQTGYTQTEAITAAATAAGPRVARTALGGTLAAGVAGMVAGPLLLRRRRLLS